MTNPVWALVAAIRFHTRLRLPGRDSTSDEVAAGFALSPLIGAVIGAAIGGAFELANEWWAAPIAAVIAIIVGMLITGGLHEDAVADSADGLGGGRTPERVLAIMKDSSIGAYGAMALWALLTFRFSALVSAEHAWVVFAVACACGRWTVLPLRRMPAAGSGLASGLGGGTGAGTLVVGSMLVLAISVAACWWLDYLPVVSGVVVAVAATGVWAWYVRHRVGGVSGDLMGAGNQLVEAAVVLMLLR